MSASGRSNKSPPVSVVLAVAMGIGALYFAQEILIPLTLSVLLAFLFAPLVTRLERLGIGRVPSVLATGAIAFGLLGSIGWVVGDQVYGLSHDLPRYQAEIARKAKQISGTSSRLSALVDELNTEVDRVSDPTSQPTAMSTATSTATSTTQASIATAATQPAMLGSTRDRPIYTVSVPAHVSPIRSMGGYLGSAIGWLATAGVVIVFVIFILLEREDLRDRMIRLISRGKYTVTTKALNDAGQRISRYILMQSIVNGTYGMTIALGLWIIGKALGHGVDFPSFVLWGLLCALLRFIPYLGPWIASAFPVLLSLAVYPSFSVFVATVGLFVGIELISNNVMEPWLYGASTGLSTVAILVAAVFWTWLWGWAGLLMSTPLTVCIVVLGKYVTHLGFLDVLLSDQPALPAGVSYYQRLLAGDRDEAVGVAKSSVKEKGLEHLSDDVLMPAILMSRRDRREDDLTSEREAEILSTTDQIIDDLFRSQPDAKADFKNSHGVAAASVEFKSLPRVIGCPSHHRSEETALHMVAAILRTKRLAMETLSTRLLPSEIEHQIGRENPQAVVISIIPRGGIAQTRYLCRRLRRKFPELKIVVNYLGKVRDYDRLLVRLRSAGANYVTTSIGQTVGQILAIGGASHDESAAPASANSSGVIVGQAIHS